MHIDLDLALLDPTAVFRTPEDVVGRKELSVHEKVEILLRWDYDARELEVAEEEGMPAGEPSLLGRIGQALEGLGYTVERDASAPTKQRGVGSGRIHKAPPQSVDKT